MKVSKIMLSCVVIAENLIRAYFLNFLSQSRFGLMTSIREAPLTVEQRPLDVGV